MAKAKKIKPDEVVASESEEIIPDEPKVAPAPEMGIRAGMRCQIPLPENLSTEEIQNTSGVILGIQDEEYTEQGCPVVTVRVKAPDAFGVERVFHVEMQRDRSTKKIKPNPERIKFLP